MPIGILGVGAYVPPHVVTNADVSAWTGVSPEWIVERTGIAERRYAPAGTATSDLAAAAADRLLAARPGTRERLAGIILATCTPDVPQPATAAILQPKLGLGRLPAFDLNAVCSGFLYGVAIAESWLRVRADGEEMLVIGADKFSGVLDRGDRRTATLFGDGAGAVLLGAVPDGYGILASQLVSDGEHHGFVGIEAGGSRTPLGPEALAAGEHLLRMDGRAVFSYATTTLRKLVERVLDECGLTAADVDRFVFHQANPRLLEVLAADLDVPMAKVVLTAPRYGNTAGASVPITLDAARPRRGEVLVLASVGGGMNAAATVVRWW